jgi:hypothetical protein
MIIRSEALKASLLAAETDNNPILAFFNRLFESSVTLSTTDGTATADGAPINATTGSTYDYWSAVPTTDQVSLQAVFGSAFTITFAGVAAHNLHTLGAAVVPEYVSTSRTNRIARSQDFSTGWVSTNMTLTAAAAVAPDGSTSMGSIIETAAASVGHLLTNSTSVSYTSGTSYVISAFVKRASGSRHFGFYIPSAIGGTAQAAAFNLSTGVATVELGTPTAGVELYADDVYRCWMKFTAGATVSSATAQFRMSDSGTQAFKSYTGDGTSGLYIWGAQIEAGAAVTPYIKTTTTSAASTWYMAGPWAVPADGDSIGWQLAGAASTTWRLRVINVDSSDTVAIGVAYIGTYMTVERRIYQGFAPVLTSTEVSLQSNVSAGGNLLGSSVVQQGSRISVAFSNLSESFVRGANWLAFQFRFNRGYGSFFAWRPAKYPEDIHYMWRDGGTLRPVNSGPQALMSAQIDARVYDG